jgi:hypothetical protein
VYPPNGQSQTDHPTSQPADQPTDRRVSVAEAAVLLGLSEEAVRSRLKRGTLRKEKAPDGTVLVVLGRGGSADRPTNGTDRPTTRTTTGQPTNQSDQWEMVKMLHEQVSFLRHQLEQEREANRENRRIIAGLVQRVPELEATPEPREAPETPAEETGRGSTAPEKQEKTSDDSQERKRSWWREFFFGPS